MRAPVHRPDLLSLLILCFLLTLTGGKAVEAEPGNAMNVSLESRWADGPSYAVEAVGNLVYCSNGGGLEIWDYTTPDRPLLRSRLATLSAIMDIKVAGGHAYLADQSGGLCCFDVSAAPSIVLHGIRRTPGLLQPIKVRGIHAYLSDSANGLWVVQYRPPHQPRTVGFCELPGSPYHLDVAGDHAYVACYSGHLQIVDISDPAGPVAVGQFTTPTYPLGTGAVSVVVQGDYAYLVDRYWGLYVLDVTDPALPLEVGNWGMVSYPLDLDIAGDFVYVVDRTAGFRIFDVSDPTPPTQRSFVPLDGTSWSVAVADGRAYVSRGWRGLTVLDVTDPDLVTVVTNYTGLANCREVAIAGGYAYVADGSRMRVLDLATLPGLTEVGYYDTGGSALGIDATHDVIAVGEWEDGVYLLRNDLIAPVGTGDPTPTRVLLQQNFPNPFNPRTTISFDLPIGAQVTLAVYGLDGTRIATLLNAHRAAGHHQVQWSGRDQSGRPVAAGTYYYRLEADGGVQTRGMVLLKWRGGGTMKTERAPGFAPGPASSH